MELRGIVYILSNMRNTTLYIGVTRDLRRRVAEHKLHINKGFTSKYNVDKLVYFEVYDRLEDGIRREKQLKNWQRAWKEKLINGINPSWKDLTEEIGVTVEFLNSVKKAYECGQYSPHSALDAESGDSGSSPE